MSRRLATFLSVAAANLVPVGGVWLLGWDLADAIAYMLAEMILFSVYACVQHAFEGRWTLAPLLFPVLFGFLIIQLLGTAMPLVESDFSEVQARAWITFIGQMLGWGALSVLASRSILWMAYRIEGTSTTLPTGGEGIESGVRSLVMFLAVFFSVFMTPFYAVFDPIVFLTGLVLGKSIFELFVELAKEHHVHAASCRVPNGS